MEFNVRILGCSSATPLSNRFPSSQLLNHNSRYFLLDCGEGTQIQLRRLKIKFQRIDKIFITHLHGDHVFGLIGLLSSYSLLGRVKPVAIYCPRDLKEMIDVTLKCSQTYLSYKINYFFHEETEDVVWEDSSLEVRKVKLNHRIPCWGFVFQEKNQGRRLIDGVVKEYGIPYGDIEKIRQGEDYIDHLGNRIKNSDLTLAPKRLKSYAYITDNRVKEGQVDSLKGVTTLYHEATFLRALKDKAIKTCHTTTDEVADLAKEIGVNKLIVGHYSSRYMDHDIPKFEAEISEIFKPIVLGKDGLKVEIE